MYKKKLKACQMRLKNFIVCDINEIKRSWAIVSEAWFDWKKLHDFYRCIYLIHTFIHIMYRVIHQPCPPHFFQLITNLFKFWFFKFLEFFNTLWEHILKFLVFCLLFEESPVVITTFVLQKRNLVFYCKLFSRYFYWKFWFT